MAEVNVPNGASIKLGRVDGSLNVGKNAIIHPESDKVLVIGEVKFDGNALVEGNLECENLSVARSGKLTIDGDLTVHGILDVSNSIEVTGAIDAGTIDVGGHVNSRSVSCKGMRVGGTAEVSGLLQAEVVDVGGKIEARGTLDVKELRVGGKARVGGGIVSGTINVGGKFENVAKLDFGELQIYGMGSLSAGSRGKRVVVSGKLKAEGDLECDQIEIAGAALILGDCKTDRVEVKGKLDVTGSLSVSEKLTVYGTTQVDQKLAGDSLIVSGRLSAERAVLTNSAEISGAADTKTGLKAKSVIITRGTRCSGPVIGTAVEIGGSGPGFSAHFWGQRVRVQAGTTQVEDVYASTLVLGPGSRAKRIFAKSAELGSGCDVDEVTYSDRLKVAEHTKIAHPPVKVDKLPESPL